MTKQQINLQNPYKLKNVPTAKSFKSWAKTALQPLNLACEITIRITTAEEIQELNNRYRKKNKPTNVLSFNYSDQDMGLIGDLILCAEVVQQEALEQHKSINAHYAHLVIHGMLHLLGYDHETPDEAEIMEAREIELLATLDLPNPYTPITENNHA